MPDNVKEIISHAMPFMAVATNGVAPKVNTTRIIEAVIIAVIVGAGAWFMMIPTIQSEMKFIATEVHELGGDLKQIKSDVQNLKIEAVRDRFTRTDFDNFYREHEKRHDNEH